MNPRFPSTLSRLPGLLARVLMGMVLSFSGVFTLDLSPRSYASAISVSQPQVQSPVRMGELAVVRINSKSYTVEVARSPQEKMKGLMGRRSLPKDTGMLFVFEQEDFQAFWMKDTLIPLDVIFVTKDRRIGSFVTMHPCTKEPCPVYGSGGRALYALEVNAGEVAKNGFKIGDKVEITFSKARPQ